MKMVYPDATPGGWELILASRAELPPSEVGGLDPEMAQELLRMGYRGPHCDVAQMIAGGFDAAEVAAALGRGPKAIEAAVATILFAARGVFHRDGRLRQVDLFDPPPLPPVKLRSPSRAGRPRKKEK